MPIRGAKRAERGLARSLEPREVLRGMIGGAGQWAGSHEQEAFLLGDALIRLELLRRDKAVNGRMFAGRLEILADGEEVDRRRAEIVHHGKNLVAASRRSPTMMPDLVKTPGLSSLARASSRSEWR